MCPIKSMLSPVESGGMRRNIKHTPISSIAPFFYLTQTGYLEEVHVLMQGVLKVVRNMTMAITLL
jgi:hypothetical protein